MELPAEQLFPGDIIHRGFRQYRVTRVEGAYQIHVRLNVHRIVNGAEQSATDTMMLAYGEIVRMDKP